MKQQPKLYQHGQYISPHIKAIFKGASDAIVKEEFQKAQDQPSEEGQISGLIKRFSASERANSKAIDMGLITKTYPQAIHYSTVASSNDMAGYGLLTAITVGGILLWPALIFIKGAITSQYTYEIVGGSIAGFIALTVVAWGFIFMSRLELFGLKDHPTIFDRQHRKVYRVTVDTKPGMLGLLKPWPVVALAYDWDLIDAEHHAELQGSTATVRREHTLTFMVRKSHDDPTVIDTFTVGAGLISEATAGPTYEHIRRFMESNGPHLPSGSKALPPPEPARSAIEKLQSLNPLSKQGQHFWRTQPLTALAVTIFFPITYPCWIVFVLCNALARHTAIDVALPPEIADAIGKPKVRKISKAEKTATDKASAEGQLMPYWLGVILIVLMGLVVWGGLFVVITTWR